MHHITGTYDDAQHCFVDDCDGSILTHRRPKRDYTGRTHVATTHRGHHCRVKTSATKVTTVVRCTKTTSMKRKQANPLLEQLE